VSFNGNGKVITPVGNSTDAALSTALQEDGKTVVAGYSFGTSNYNFAVVRYNLDGTLDTTFNGTGKVITPVGSGNDFAYSVALQADGKIVVAGYSENATSSDYALVRYNTNGTLDTSFNGTGKIITVIGSGGSLAKAVAIQADGKIVAAGWSVLGANNHFTVVRYNSDGTLDTSFNVTGKVVTLLSIHGDHADAVAVQPDGKIVAAGSVIVTTYYDFAVVRYNSDGSLDNTFNGNGKVITSIGPFGDDAGGVAVQPDGKTVIAGTTNNGTDEEFALARYNVDGTLDTSFNGSGKVITRVSSNSDGASAVLIQPDGRILAAGSSNNNGNTDFALLRYDTNGALDTSFNGTGKVVSPIGNGNDFGAAAGLRSDGRIVVAGTVNNGTNDDFGAIRYFGLPCPNATPTNTATPTTTPTPIGPVISGAVTYGNAIGAPTPRFVSNVTLSGMGSVPVSTTTNFPLGTYSLSGFGTGAYTVTPSKIGGVVNISSFDAAKIAQHVAGVNFLTGNQLIVADVSGNGTLSSFDAGQVARYVAAVAGYGSTGSWIFSPANRTYPGVANDIPGQDYVALLMGEVSGNWVNTGSRPVRDAALADPENVGPERAITVRLPDVVTEIGNEVIIPVQVQGAAGKQIVAYEFDLKYDPSVVRPTIDPIDVKNTASRALSVVTNGTQPGLLRVVVYGALPIEQNGVLLNLRFTAVGQSGAISPLTFERIMFNEGEPTVTITAGRIELSYTAAD